MANAYSLPLLQLPSTALIKAIQLSNVREQFKLSKLSKQSLCIVKTSVENHFFELKIKFKEGWPVCINNITARNEYRFNLQPINSLKEDSVPLESIKNLIVQVAEVFPNLSISLDSNNAPHPRYLMDLIPFTKQLNLKLGFLGVYLNNPDDELCKFMFKKCSDAKSMHMYCNTSPTFQLSPEQVGIFRGEEFSTGLPWFSMNHVLHGFMDCQYLNLTNLSFSATELNAFLKNWIRGSGVKNLICKRSEEFDMERVLDGITAVPGGEVKISLNKGHYIAHRSDCLIIEQSNGVKSVVGTFGKSLFALSTEFELGTGEKYGDYEERRRGRPEVIEVFDERAEMI